MISIATYRACALCTHGRAPQDAAPHPEASDRVCVCPHVTGVRNTDWPMGVPVSLARANTGPCGPEAAHLHFAGLQP